jgi:hypothetical protein
VINPKSILAAVQAAWPAPVGDAHALIIDEYGALTIVVSFDDGYYEIAIEDECEISLDAVLDYVRDALTSDGAIRTEAPKVLS